MLKKLIATLLVAAMSFSMAACSGKSGKDPEVSNEVSSTKANVKADYINLDSSLPIVKAGTKDVTLTMMVAAQDGAKDVKSTWLWTWLQKKANIKLDIKLVNWFAKEEQKQLAFASGTLPDIMYNMQLSTNDLINYGQSEHQLLDLTPYLNEQYAPNIVAAYKKEPDGKAAAITPDGATYTITALSIAGEKASRVGGYNMFVDQRWLDAIGLKKMPATIDEFTEMLRTFKKQDPMKLGDTMVPLGGYSGADYPTGYILEALGFNVPTFRVETIYTPVLRSGKATIPCCDDVYAEYLKIANNWYKEGLISPDYFTVDWKVTRAQASKGLCGAYAQWGMTTMSPEYDYVKNWAAVGPLTSQFNNTPIHVKNSNISAIGNFAVSANCKYPEVAVRFADWFYTEQGAIYSTSGPMKGSEDTLGMFEGWSFYNDGKHKDLQYKEVKQLDIYSGYWCIGLNGIMPSGKSISVVKQEKFGAPVTDPDVVDSTTAGGWMVTTSRKACDKYLSDPLPSYLYFDKKTSARIADLSAIIKNYALSETAKFITGSRPIKEVNDYLKEMKTIGGAELIGYYQEAYQKYLAAKK